MDDFELIRSLRAAVAPATATQAAGVSTLTGTVTADSADGSVTVDLGGASTTGDGGQALELPTQVDCRDGDTVMVTLVGGSPVVTGVVGGGDRTREETAPAVTDTQAYYLLADSAPDQPTEDAHDGWSTTEPVWSADSTQTLWRSVRSVTVGGEIAWSAPCEVSAYANVTIARNAIVSTVEESYVTSDAASATYATKTEVTQTASALDVRITSTDSKATSAQADASSAATKADAAKDAADKASTDAATAQATASSAASVANAASKTATNAASTANDASKAASDAQATASAAQTAASDAASTADAASKTATAAQSTASSAATTADAAKDAATAAQSAATDASDAASAAATKADAASKTAAGAATKADAASKAATSASAAAATATETANGAATTASGAASDAAAAKQNASSAQATATAAQSAASDAGDAAAAAQSAASAAATKAASAASAAATAGATATAAQSAASDAMAEAKKTSTLVRAYEDGVLAAKVGQTYGALVNAGGSFDVRPVTWDADGSPTLGEYVASFWNGGMKVKTDDVGEGYVDIDKEAGTTTFGSDWATHVTGRQLHLSGTASGAVEVDGILKADDVNAKTSVASPSYILGGKELKNRDLVKWTSFAQAIVQGSAYFVVRNGMAMLTVNFQTQNETTAWGANYLTSEQQAELLKYQPPDSTAKITGFDIGGVIWTLSFGGDGKVYLWPTGGTASKYTWLTSAFTWVVD